MIPLSIAGIEGENDREFIQRLFLQNERGMYAMAMSIGKEYNTACDMVSASCVRIRDLLLMKYFTVILPSRWFYRARMKHRLL